MQDLLVAVQKYDKLMTIFIFVVRNASKKASGSTRNKKGHPRPKHRGWKVQDSHHVSAGTLLATQLTPRFHPGLNVMYYIFISFKLYIL